MVRANIEECREVTMARVGLNREIQNVVEL